MRFCSSWNIYIKSHHTKPWHAFCSLPGTPTVVLGKTWGCTSWHNCNPQFDHWKKSKMTQVVPFEANKMVQLESDYFELTPKKRIVERRRRQQFEQGHPTAARKPHGRSGRWISNQFNFTHFSYRFLILGKLPPSFLRSKFASPPPPAQAAGPAKDSPSSHVCATLGRQRWPTKISKKRGISGERKQCNML